MQFFFEAYIVGFGEDRADKINAAEAVDEEGEIRRCLGALRAACEGGPDARKLSSENGIGFLVSCGINCVGASGGSAVETSTYCLKSILITYAGAISVVCGGVDPFEGVRAGGWCAGWGREVG